ncbi:MAG: ABC transporter permease [Gemmatimonadota bacterium]
MDTLRQHLKIAARSLLRSPGLLLVATLSLALGISVNTTIFSAVDVFLVRPLPYPEPDRLFQVWTTNQERGWEQSSISPPDFLDWRRESRALDIAAEAGSSFNLTGAERPERLNAVRVSDNFFRVIGINPALGRTFRADEERAGNDRVVIVSHAFWQTHLAADPRAINRTLILNGTAHTVIGVMPSDFRFGSPDIQLWAPLGLTGEEKRDSRYFEVIARGRAGTTLESARAELTGITKRLEAAYPESNRGNGVFLHTLKRELFDEGFWTASLICTVAVAFVLLIACANVADLLLVRAASREREIAVRTALGAGRARIAGQLLTESLMLALAGGALGLVFSYWGVKILVGMMPSWFPMVDQIGISARVLIYTALITLGSGLMFGLAPALQAARPNLTTALREGSRGSTVGSRRGRLRNSLVISEIALALVLMISAGLLVKSAIGLQRVPLGFRTDSLVTMRVSLPLATYPDTTRVAEFYQRVLARIEALPPVDHAAAVRCIPLSCGMGTYYSVESEPEPEPDRRPVVQFRAITPGYLATLGLRIVQGRAFGETDRSGAPRVALVNETFARKHWPDGQPVGQRLRFAAGHREIVGVVTDTREFGPDEDVPPMVYFPQYQEGERAMALMVKSGADPAELVAALRAEVWAVDASLPVYDVQTMDDRLQNALGGDLILSKLLGFFAVAALILAVIGVYGVMAYSVSQRTQEMGIRMAIGAQRTDILRLVVRQGVVLASIGLGIGLAIALAVTRTLSLFLHGVSAFDLQTFVVVTLSLAGAALAASYGPAMRATRVDPQVALRTE